jgi:hypothetical protein
VIREVTHDQKFVSALMADKEHKMDKADKEAIKERSKLRKESRSMKKTGSNESKEIKKVAQTTEK